MRVPRITELNFDDIKIESRRSAGVDGFDITHPEHGILVTIYGTDPHLLAALYDVLRTLTNTAEEK